jgi:hypothetical protein
MPHSGVLWEGLMADLLKFEPKLKPPEAVPPKYEPYMNTLVVCFGCTERWVAAIEGDGEGEFKLNHLECPYCHQMKGIAIAEVLHRHWRAMQMVESPNGGT